MLVEGPDRDSNDAPLYEAMLADDIRVMDRAGHWRRVEETVPLLLTQLDQAGVRARCSCRQDTLSVAAPFERFPLQLQRRVLVSIALQCSCPSLVYLPLRGWRRRLHKLLYEIFYLSLSIRGKIADHLFQAFHGYRIRLRAC